MALTTIERKVAPKILAEIRKHDADWREYAADMARQGYRPERCIHGSYLWVDHDIPCGWCEDGCNGVYERALPEIHRIGREWQAILDAAVATSALPGLSRDERQTIIDVLVTASTRLMEGE